MVSTVYIGLGSNQGDRHGFLRKAMQALADFSDIDIEAWSSIYESPALVLPGHEAQPAYLNAVLVCKTILRPPELLDRCLAVETSLGRTRTPGTRWEPRTIDLDLLIWGRLTIQSQRLHLPHPQIHLRPFVLLPLAELDEDLIIPAPFDSTVRYLLSECPDTIQTIRTKLTLNRASL